MMVEKTLEQYPFVRWDRFTGGEGSITAFGWIDRPQDAYKDFMVLYFEKGEVDSYMTSSARYSLEIYKIMNSGSGRGHHNCKRVEKHFRIKNSIKL